VRGQREVEFAQVKLDQRLSRGLNPTARESLSVDGIRQELAKVDDRITATQKSIEDVQNKEKQLTQRLGGELDKDGKEKGVPYTITVPIRTRASVRRSDFISKP
jgi:hypothetical protein